MEFIINTLFSHVRNCLFRALADQLYGNNKAIGGYHMKLRREVVEYIRQHREDFEPFVDEDVTFDRHVELLEQDGTYAGEDIISIVKATGSQPGVRVLPGVCEKYPGVRQITISF